MIYFKYFLPFIAFLCVCNQVAVFGQSGGEKKKIVAGRVTNPPLIDGYLNEPEWSLTQPATDFYQYEPYNDRSSSQKSEIQVLFDDFSIYIGARLYDDIPSGILTELGLRDADSKLNADQFWVDINPFNDGIYGFRFKVSSSGVQTDVNLSGGSKGQGDIKWDAVWKSKVTIGDEGWVVEMEIPYAALRFPKNNIKDWGINFWREIRRTRETSSWNYVNRSMGSTVGFMGLLGGIEGIEPPLRLAVYPYVSSYLENSGPDQAWKSSLNGGMDLKYGLDESFTLDMTLIPDFGQVQSDALVLNLTPFEVKYDEKRQFFTEGLELYSKANLFYSRRVGSRPEEYHISEDELKPNEVISFNPVETRLLNAAKLSGRTHKGLGIGVFNSITAASRAIILDTLRNETRLFTTQPLTNYSLVVLDQSLPNNSFISLINTNVSGARPGYSANVTGMELRLRDKSNKYTFNTEGAISQHYLKNTSASLGFKYDIFAGKTGGPWQYYYYRSVMSDRYDQNDLGFQSRNNEIEDGLSVSYNHFKPYRRTIFILNEVSLEYSGLYAPNTFTGMSMEYDFKILFDTRFFASLNAEYEPFGKRDYYEPRIAGLYYETGAAYELNISISSDYRKDVYVDGGIGYEKTNSATDLHQINVNFFPTLRINDRFNVSYGLVYREASKDIGFVSHLNSTTAIFGLRRSPTTINSIKTSYIFSNILSLDLNLRHYWSRVFYKGTYYLLNQDGHLSLWSEPFSSPDINYNAFTVDMKLVWNFSPGSQLSIVWKNLIDSNKDEVPASFTDNLFLTLKEPHLNSLSMKILYYLDYQQARRWIKT